MEGDSLEELRRDALRYRFLRKAGAWESEIRMDELSQDPEKFDAEVDKMMEQETQ